MALRDKNDPNLSILKKGADRHEIEFQLGLPIDIARVEGNTIAVYEYTIGDEPSAGRAIAHGTIYVLTLGLWEVVGTPVEAITGDRNRIAVTYDDEYKVIGLRRTN